MTFPTGTVISTTNVEAADSSPALARADIYNLITAFNQLVASINTAGGVSVLNGDGTISSDYLPANYVKNGTITFFPENKIVNIKDVLRLNQRVTADNSLLTSSSAGDIIYLTDGDAGNPCLAVYNGSAWKVVRLATTVGDVGAAISTTAFTIKENHLAHMAEDIDRVETKVDRIDNRIWAILIILCGATFVPMILDFIKTS